MNLREMAEEAKMPVVLTLEKPKLIPGDWMEVPNEPFSATGGVACVQPVADDTALDLLVTSAFSKAVIATNDREDELRAMLARLPGGVICEVTITFKPHESGAPFPVTQNSDVIQVTPFIAC